VKLNIDGALDALARRSETDRNLIKSFLGARDESNLSPDEKLQLGLMDWGFTSETRCPPS
jgi:hypothetical protein